MPTVTVVLVFTTLLVLIASVIGRAPLWAAVFLLWLLIALQVLPR